MFDQSFRVSCILNLNSKLGTFIDIWCLLLESPRNLNFFLIYKKKHTSNIFIAITFIIGKSSAITISVSQCKAYLVWENCSELRMRDWRDVGTPEAMEYTDHKKGGPKVGGSSGSPWTQALAHYTTRNTYNKNTPSNCNQTDSIVALVMQQPGKSCVMLQQAHSCQLLFKRHICHCLKYWYEGHTRHV